MIGADLTGDVASIGPTGTVVTLVEGRSFCLSDPAGDLQPGTVQGLFVRDARALARWELRIDGGPVEALSSDLRSPYAADFVGRARPAPGRADAELVVFRRRRVGRGMNERIEVTNHGTVAVETRVELLCDSDFAGIFEVKNGQVHERPARTAARDEAGGLVLSSGGDPPQRVRIWASQPPIVEPGVLTWRPILPPGQSWEVCLEVSVALGGDFLEPRFRCGAAEELTVPSQRRASWRAALPEVRSSSPELDAAVARSGEDLGSLRIYDPEHPDVPILAAGAPWYMTLFGRDAILTAWMTLLADRSLALGVLDTLARLQGKDVDARTEEEPGKILHEVRLGHGDGLTFSVADVYFGSIDVTPLFVMLLGEARRWGLDDAALTRLLPHADRALEWIERFGDRDGDGYVEYQRTNPSGLANQGWKDSGDGVRFADGRFPQPPIALCEVQGYVHAAYLARAHLADDLGDTATRERYRAKAADLRHRFNEDFWLDDRGWFALALDADKRPVDALASNMGHCLWTEIVDPDRAVTVAERLLSDELSSGWGIRTLATSMAAYNPVSYHNGSIWPHDNALVAAGLARYGFVDHAHRVIGDQLAVAASLGGRLPELFAGFARREFGAPASYPSSCSPQAWAAAAPLLWLRVLLGIDPWAPRGELWCRPSLPSWLGRLTVDGIEVAGRRLTIRVEGDDVVLDGAGELTVHRGLRPLLDDAFAPSR